MRLGNEVGNAGRHVDVPAGDFLADPRDFLGKIDDAVEVDRSLARQSNEKVQLDPLPTFLEGLPTSFEEVVVVDRLADLVPHVVACNLGRKGEAALAYAPH